jgi:hypothetical protein
VWHSPLQLMFKKVKRLHAMYRLASFIDDVIQQLRKANMNSQTLWSAAISAVLLFIGTLLGWTPEQIQSYGTILVGLVLSIMGRGIGKKIADAKVEAAKMSGVRDPGGNE